MKAETIIGIIFMVLGVFIILVSPFYFSQTMDNNNITVDCYDGHNNIIDGQVCIQEDKLFKNITASFFVGLIIFFMGLGIKYIGEFN